MFKRKTVTIFLVIKINGQSNGQRPIKVEIEDGATLTIDQPITTKFSPDGPAKVI